MIGYLSQEIATCRSDGIRNDAQVNIDRRGPHLILKWSSAFIDAGSWLNSSRMFPVECHTRVQARQATQS